MNGIFKVEGGGPEVKWLAKACGSTSVGRAAGAAASSCRSRGSAVPSPASISTTTPGYTISSTAGDPLRRQRAPVRVSARCPRAREVSALAGGAARWCGKLRRLGTGAQSGDRIATHPRVFTHPSTLEEALAFTEAVRDRPNAVLIAPGPRHWDIFTELCRTTATRGNLVPDVYFAALALESRSEWQTTDRDYSRFPGAQVEASAGGLSGSIVYGLWAIPCRLSVRGSGTSVLQDR
jgi:hypothetical protein